MKKTRATRWWLTVAEYSAIEWTDHTFNPWIGCTHVSEGCRNCYAEAKMDTRLGKVQWGPGKPRVRTSAAYWKKALVWNRKAASFYECDGCGKREFRKWDNSLPPGGLACCSTKDCLGLPESDASIRRPRVFCASMADWLDPEVPIEWLAYLLELIAATPNLDWLLLTKRPEKWLERITYVWLSANVKSSVNAYAAKWLDGEAPANVWMGTSVENQEAADTRIPALLKIPAKLRFLSMEPLLGKVDVYDYLHSPRKYCDSFVQGEQMEAGYCGRCAGHIRPVLLDWVIVGGESGPKARPMHPDWAGDLRDQCSEAGVPFLFKQWGEWAPNCIHDSAKACRTTPRPEPGKMGCMFHCGKARAGRLLDGVEHSAMPELRS